MLNLDEFDQSKDIDMYFMVSILTDQEKFDKKVSSEGLPHYNYADFNWKELESDMSDIIFQGIDLPEKTGSVTVWNDVLCSASKPIMSEQQMVSVYQTAIGDLINETFDSQKARSMMLTPYEGSAPPAELYFKIHFEDGMPNLLPAIMKNLAKIFYANQKLSDWVDIAKAIKTRRIVRPGNKLSRKMFSVLTQHFDTPFENNALVTIFTNRTEAIHFSEDKNLRETASHKVPDLRSMLQM